VFGQGENYFYWVFVASITRLHTATVSYPCLYFVVHLAGNVKSGKQHWLHCLLSRLNL